MVGKETFVEMHWKLSNCRKQARAALELKTQSIFAEAFELQERLAQQKEEKNKQRALCEQLAQQVGFDEEKFVRSFVRTIVNVIF